MFYREAGQFKTSYPADQAIFPIKQDLYAYFLLDGCRLYRCSHCLPEIIFSARLMLPFLVLSLAAIGLNILTGYAGQLSLGTGGFMATGAFAAYKLSTAFPGDASAVCLSTLRIYHGWSRHNLWYTVSAY